MTLARVLFTVVALFVALGATAEEAPIRLEPSSVVADAGDGISVRLKLSRAVPYRLSLLDGPPRVVIDLDGVDHRSLNEIELDQSEHVLSLRTGRVQKGWSRLVLDLDGPYTLTEAGETVLDDGATIVIGLSVASVEEFRAAVVRGRDAVAATSATGADIANSPQKSRQTGDKPLVVMIDPGHGGIDPGAEAGGLVEAAVILDFAIELAAHLRAAGMVVDMTRAEDDFVPLETRVSLARSAGADVFLSLHADTISEGVANGATIYTLSDAASDSASARLAEAHDRADLLAGVDLAGQDDVLAGVMMDLARTETRPRGNRLASEIVAALGAAGIKTHRHPIQQAAFSVLKSPD
ncbi:MAG: N-acetylmuramoyl-L-alanine amidase, partial [Rhodobacteraceae bacterium]|nr:N-acetylmuramoyl-L-alanine amidase [Paracoccaceae bacterium]